MKKVLLTFLVAFMAVVAYAQVDTVKFIPDKEGIYELKVDTIKYPYLADKEVSWFAGFPDVSVSKNKYCAREILNDNLTVIQGKTLLHLNSVQNNWGEFFKKDELKNTRTITIFYVHKISTKSIVEANNDQGWYEKDNFSNCICDTVGVLHILKKLGKESIKNVVINGSTAESTFKVQEGDTVKVEFNLKKHNTDSLDVQMYGISDGEQLITHSIFDTLEFVPEETYTNLIPVLSNDMGDYEVDSRKFSVTVYPKFKVTGITYTKSQNGITNIVESPDSLNAQVIATKGDSVQLVINTNIEEASLFDGKIPTYNWNKDGKNLSSNIINKGDTLIIPSYTKEDVGLYNCLVSYDNKVTTVTFNLSYNSPTANDVVTTSNILVSKDASYLTIKNASNKEIKVYNISGKLILNKYLSTDYASLVVPNEIIIVKVDNQTFKLK